MAIFRFDDFCERWASAYRPISHVSGKASKQKRFFRHDTLDERMDVAKNITTVSRCDLFMSVITAFDGELASPSEQASRPNFYSWRRHVLFWARGEGGTVGKVAPIDEVSAAEAKARGVEAATDFLAFISKLSEDKRSIWAGFDPDSVEISTLPVSFNGWWITVINFCQFEPRQKCVIDSRYDANLVAELFAGTNIPALIQNNQNNNT